MPDVTRRTAQRQSQHDTQVELTALRDLAEETLARLRAPRRPTWGELVAELREMSNARLRELLRAARGERSAKILTTKLMKEAIRADMARKT